MKTKSFSILLVVVAFVLANIVIGAVFVSSGCNNESVKKQEAAAAAAKAAEEEKFKQEEAAKKIPPKHPNPLFGTPFKYDHTLYGDKIPLRGVEEATAGILVDIDSRQVLWAKNPQKPFPIASMTKMMTILVIMETLENNNTYTLDTSIPVSRATAKIGGSQVYLDPREAFPLKELMKAVAIKSANDAAYQVAEFFGGGDVYSFVSKMNNKAKELNLAGTKFFNPHGLPGSSPAEDNVSSPESMVVLAEHLLDYPQVVEWASTPRAPFREEGTKGCIMMDNHNHLVGQCPGVDGMKTGWIARSGFCITVTCKRNGRRLVEVVNGFPDRKTRDAFAVRLLNWGYAQSPDGSTLAEEAKKAEDKPAATAKKSSSTKKAAATSSKKKKAASEE